MKQVIRAFQETALVIASLLRTTLDSIRQNGGLAALSVVLAFGLWIFVTDAENPTRTRVVPEEITVEAVNMPADVVLARQLDPVRVRVRVPEDVFGGLTAADFEATVDLDGLGIGVYELPVQARAPSRGNVRVENVLPEKINVTLVPLVSKSVSIEVDVQGSPPAGYVMRSPQVEDDTALVSGPQEKVGQVAKAVASVNVDARTDPVNQSVRLVARNQSGGLVQGVTLEPGITDVSIDIDREEFSRAVAVSPRTTGAPADGYNVISVSVNPVSVVVTGSKEFIEGAATIPTRSVDISGATDDVVRSVSLDVPSGVSITGGVSVVTVTVKIDPAVGVITFGVPVNATNLGEGISIVGSLPFVQVTLFGPIPRLRSLSPNDIRAVADLNDKGAGVHKLQVKVSAPEGLDVRSVSPPEIEVTLEKR